MKMPSDVKGKMNSAFQLLTGPEISVSTFENIRSLVKGLYPEVDKKLEVCSKALGKLKKIQSGDIISLSAENLPEKDEKQKKRKKVLLLFIETLKDLKSEIKRVNGELQNSQGTPSNQLMNWGRIIKFAKGPLGLITLVAIVILVTTPIFIYKINSSQQAKSAAIPAGAKQKIQVISYQGKKLPLTQLFVGYGSDCDRPHYHAISGKVVAVDGSIVVDPEGCGFGKVANTQVVIIEK